MKIKYCEKVECELVVFETEEGLVSYHRYSEDNWYRFNGNEWVACSPYDEKELEHEYQMYHCPI